MLDIAKPAQDTLFWSKRGQVACTAHAPDPKSDDWRQEGWCAISNPRRGIVYQCQQCAPDGRPHRHRSAAEKGADSLARAAQ